MENYGSTESFRLRDGSLPLVMSPGELGSAAFEACKDFEVRLTCDSTLAARAALVRPCLSAVLPAFAVPVAAEKLYWEIPIPALDSNMMHFRLAWNPRLLRLNPHVIRCRDFLVRSLTAEFRRA